MTLLDAAARERIRTDLDTTLVIEAAAGTGKTTELIARLLGVLRSGRGRLDRVALVTFTDKAAGEMKLRLRAELERAIEQAREHGHAAERAHFEQALSALELAHIDTIHGFCAELLRERPIEAGVDPCFEVLDEFGAARLQNEAFEAWFAHALRDPPEGVRRVLRRGAGSKQERFGPKRQLFDAARTLIEQRDFDAPWGSPEYDREAEIDALVRSFAEVGELAGFAKRASDYLAVALRGFRDFASELAAAERTRPRDYDALEAQLLQLGKRYEYWKRTGSGVFSASGPARETVLERRADLRAALDTFLAHAEADLASKLQRELWQVVSAHEALKHKAGALDFVDLLRCTRDLLRDDVRARADLQRRFTHVFVDEFQDIDPVQAEILLWLASEATATPGTTPRVAPGRLFAVGDPKQSIYRFRRADVAMYERLKRDLLDDGAVLLHLTTSFRSLPEIQAVVNAAFAPLMNGAKDAAQAEYVPLSPSRAEHAEQPALIALPVPDAYGERGDLRKNAVEEAYPKAVAAFVAWLLRESGLHVEEHGLRMPVAARHVCLLFKRFQKFGEDLTRGYVRGLEARHIPHVLVGGRSLHGREEVIALRAALAAIEWPDDELSVYATLHGPFFAILDQDLLRFRTAIAGSLHPLRPLPDEIAREHAQVAEALLLLRRLHRARNRRATAQTIGALLEATRAHAGVGIWPTGEQALANLLGLIDTARSFDRRAALSFRGFVEWLHAQSEAGAGSEAPIVEEGTEGVRLMTVHKAKGLEFPVVVLCDPTAPTDPMYASRYVDPERALWAQRLCGCRPLELQHHEPEVLRHDRAESIRVAYVAATRARDLLVVPVVDETRRGHAVMGWTDLLAPAAHAAYAVHAAAYPVVLDDLGAAPIGGLQQMRLLGETERSAHWVAEHRAWVESRSNTLALAAVPTRPALSVTALAAARAQAAVPPPADAARVAVERTSIERGLTSGRPRGARFGSLVHAVLAQVSLHADEHAVHALAATCGRLLAATPVEVDAAQTAVCAALAHPLLQRAAGSLECRREVPVVHVLPDGTWAEGVIDLAFRESAGWVIVDFKTDAELAEHGAYAEQVRLYMEAVRTATGEPTCGVLLGV